MPTPKPAADRPRPGRPRKVTHERIVEAALAVMEREGLGALTLRALGQELQLSHSNLYNYVRNIEDVEVEVLQRLISGLIAPSATQPGRLREELVAFLKSVRALMARHPDVTHPPMGSSAWRSFALVTSGWVEALGRFEAQPRDAVVAYTAMLSYVASVATRDRVYGPDHAARSVKELQKAFPESRALADVRAFVGTTDAFGPTLALLIERLLPGLTAAAARKPRS